MSIYFALLIKGTMLEKYSRDGENYCLAFVLK